MKRYISNADPNTPPNLSLIGQGNISQHVNCIALRMSNKQCRQN